MMARKPPHLGSNHQPWLLGRGPGLASINSGRRRRRRATLHRGRERKGLERNGDGAASAPVSDHRGAVADADEPGAAIPVQDCLVRLKRAGRAESQLEEFGASDRVQAEGVHAGQVRRRYWASSRSRIVCEHPFVTSQARVWQIHPRDPAAQPLGSGNGAARTRHGPRRLEREATFPVIGRVATRARRAGEPMCRRAGRG
jgi:hypothetical protein